jgi:hypothetical protein
VVKVPILEGSCWPYGVFWTFFSHFKQVTNLQLVGDSKVIVDWFSLKNNMQVASLKPWMEKKIVI